MTKPLDLSTIDKELEEVEAKFDTIKYYLEKLDQEIAAYVHMKLQLEENISVLKDKDIIPVATEFKKVKEELKKIKTRITFLNVDRDNHQKAMIQAEKNLYTLRLKRVEFLKTRESNVIQGNFESTKTKKKWWKK